MLSAAFTLENLSVVAKGTVRFAGFRPNATFTGSVDKVSEFVAIDAHNTYKCVFKVAVTITIAGKQGSEPTLVGFHMSNLDGLTIRVVPTSLSTRFYNLGELQINI